MILLLRVRWDLEPKRDSEDFTSTFSSVPFVGTHFKNGPTTKVAKRKLPSGRFVDSNGGSANVRSALSSNASLQNRANGIVLGLLAVGLFATGCSNGVISPTGPVVSGQALGVAPIEMSAQAAGVSYLYVADDLNPYFAQVDFFQRNDLAKGIIGKISKRIEYPDGIYVDSSDTLYVANELASGGHDRVTVYKSGADKPFRIYRGFCDAADVLAGADGTVYIADLCGKTRRQARARDDICIENGAVHVYAPDSLRQIRVLRFKGGPVSLTLDNKNDLYVGFENACGYKGQVRRYAPGAVKGVDLLPPNNILDRRNRARQPRRAACRGFTAWRSRRLYGRA